MSDIKTVHTCRCCLNNNDPVFQMSDIVYDEDEKITASQSYFELTGLILENIGEDSLKICSTCQSHLRSSFTFRKACLDSHKYLSRIKEESHCDEEIYCEDIKPPEYDFPVDVVSDGIKCETGNAIAVKLDRKIRTVKVQPTTKRVIKKPATRKIRKSIVLSAIEEDYKVVSHQNGEVAIDYIEAKFLCTVCDVSAKNYAMLIKHRQNHHNILTRDCKMCGEIKCENYENHISIVHPDYRPQQCLMCEAGYINHKELKQHLRTHMKAEQHQCMNCFSTFKTTTALRHHIVNNCGNPKLKKTDYNCHVCGLPVGDVKKVNQHVFEKHPKDFRKRYYPCHQCKRVLVGAQSGNVCKRCIGQWTLHTKALEAKNIFPQIQCDKCNDKFYEEEELFCHEIGNHSSRSYCFLCDKAFWNFQEKREHQKEVHPVDKIRRHRMCDECGKVFKCNFLLQNHLLTHNSKPHIKCPYPGCESAFYLQTILRRHIICSHKKDYKYECHYCGKRINFYNYILTHFTRAHFPHLRKYECDVNTCPRRFASVTDKKRHMVTHTGEKLPLSASKKKSLQNTGTNNQQVLVLEGIFHQLPVTSALQWPTDQH